mgnify:CR=1 FL=1
MMEPGLVPPADVLVLVTLCGALVKFVLFPMVYPLIERYAPASVDTGDNRFKTMVSLGLSLVLALVVGAWSGMVSRPDGVVAVLWLMLGTALTSIGQHHLLKNLFESDRR